MFARACAVVGVVVVLLAGAAAGPAAALAKMYVQTTVAADGSGHVEGYGVVSGAPVNDHFQLDVVRGGVLAATATGVGYVQLAPFAVAAGDEVTLTDVDTGVPYVATLTGAPTLAATACGATKFAGTRDEGASVAVKAVSSDGGLVGPAIVASGAGTTFGGGITTALTSAWTLAASQQRVMAADFTVYSDVEVAVTDCPPAPVAAAPAPAVTSPEPAPAPAPAPAAAAAPAPAPKDVLAPLATLKLRLANAYKSLVRGTFADAVTITEAGTVTQTLYLDRGAKAAKATVLGRGRSVAGRAGAVSVKVLLSKAGKAHVAARKAIKVKLVTTVADTAGNARVLAPKHFTLKRGR